MIELNNPEVLSLVFSRILEILKAPFQEPLIFWELGPLIVTMFIMEIYFGRYKDEEYGWASTLSNALMLFFIGSNLLHYLYLTGSLDFNFLRSQIPLYVMGVALVFAILDFYHIWPALLAFDISSVLPIHIIAFISIIVVHMDVILDEVTLYASIGLFVMILIFMKIMQFFIPKANKFNI